jgi:hypothetical protein
MIDNAEFDRAFATRMLANREAHGLMGEPVRIEQDRVSCNLPLTWPPCEGNFPTQAASTKQSCKIALEA